MPLRHEIGNVAMLAGWLIAVLGQHTIVCAASPTSASIDFQAVRELKQAWIAASADLERMQKQVYAQNPKLKEWEEKLSELAALSGSLSTNRARVGEYLKGHEYRERQYRTFKDLWSDVAMEDAAADPEQSELLKLVLMVNDRWRERARELARSNPAFANMASFEDFWKAYRNYACEQRPMSIQKIRELERQAGFPEFVTAQAQADGVARIKREYLYGSALYSKTPNELKQAREKVHKLAIRLGNLWPQWHES